MSAQEKHCKRRKRNALIISVFILVLIVLTLVGVVVYLVTRDPCPASGWYDPKSKIGDIHDKSKEEIEAELNKIVDEGMFHISIASIISFNDGKSLGEARIVNPSLNSYNMKVKINLDDTNEVIYESKGIAPGTYIETISLNRNLPAGRYNATALFTAYTKDDLLYVGQIAAKITIFVDK